MQNIPVNLNGYKLLVADEPCEKTFKDKNGVTQVSRDQTTNEPQWTVSLFAKPKEAGPSGKRAKGEEIKVTLPGPPMEGVEEGVYVELVAPTVSHYLIQDGDRANAGLSFKAQAVSPIG